MGVALTSMWMALALTACPGPDWPKCENDDHCKENDGDEVNYHCVFGQCQECGRDADCKANERCNKKTYKCEVKCSDDASCDSGFMCEAGACIKGERKDAEGESCVEEGDCKDGFTCKEGKCVEGGDGAGAGAGTKAEGEPCVETGDCQSGLTCSEGTCQKTEVTVTEVECAEAGLIHFEFNAHDLGPEARESLNTFATCMEQHPDWKVVIEGHADERGTPEFNMSLGEKRANEIKKYMSNLGVEKKRMRTLSYGEERPVDATSTEDAWAKNRRAEFRVQ